MGRRSGTKANGSHRKEPIGNRKSYRLGPPAAPQIASKILPLQKNPRVRADTISDATRCAMICDTLRGTAWVSRIGALRRSVGFPGASLIPSVRQGRQSGSGYRRCVRHGKAHDALGCRFAVDVDMPFRILLQPGMDCVRSMPLRLDCTSWLHRLELEVCPKHVVRCRVMRSHPAYLHHTMHQKD